MLCVLVDDEVNAIHSTFLFHSLSGDGACVCVVKVRQTCTILKYTNEKPPETIVYFYWCYYTDRSVAIFHTQMIKANGIR